MSTTVDTSFITEFEAMVKHAYQRQGPKLLGTHRTDGIVRGDTVIFPKLGAANAYDKARHAQLTYSDTAHTEASATLSEKWYADLIEYYDEFKTNIDLRGSYAKAGAMALGREQDDIIISAIETGAGTTVLDDDTNRGGSNQGLEIATVRYMRELVLEANVPDDNLWWVIGPQQFNELVSQDQFASADYNITKPYASPQNMFSFYGFNFIVHNGLTTSSKGGHTQRETLLFHADAVGSVSPDNFNVRASFDWLAKEQNWQVSASFSMGTTVIDDAGVWVVDCNESA
jgi:hypothetical protein